MPRRPLRLLISDKQLLTPQLLVHRHPEQQGRHQAEEVCPLAWSDPLHRLQQVGKGACTLCQLQCWMLLSIISLNLHNL